LIVLGLGGLVLLLIGGLASGALFREGLDLFGLTARAPVAAPAVVPTPPSESIEPAAADAAAVAVVSPVVETGELTPRATALPVSEGTPVPLVREQPTSTATPAPTPTAMPFAPITHIVLPRIKLEADVVPANLIEADGGLTWEVPAFKAGHAEGTAGAGEIGNAVLLGHVTSRRSGDVFLRLDQVKLGDTVAVFSDATRFDYKVVEIRSVTRTEVGVLDPTDTASVSMITCTGAWNPLIWDYMERLVVRAELVS
jgi:LPXTG-site transpeptidase (sortase) family protein